MSLKEFAEVIDNMCKLYEQVYAPEEKAIAKIKAQESPLKKPSGRGNAAAFKASVLQFFKGLDTDILNYISVPTLLSSPTRL